MTLRSGNLWGKVGALILAALGGYMLAIVYAVIVGFDDGIAAMDRAISQVMLFSVITSLAGATIVMLLPTVAWVGHDAVAPRLEALVPSPVADQRDSELGRALKLRLVRGEISLEEYERVRVALDA